VVWIYVNIMGPTIRPNSISYWCRSTKMFFCINNWCYLAWLLDPLYFFKINISKLKYSFFVFWWEKLSTFSNLLKCFIKKKCIINHDTELNVENLKLENKDIDKSEQLDTNAMNIKKIVPFSIVSVISIKENFNWN